MKLFPYNPARMECNEADKTILEYADAYGFYSSHRRFHSIARQSYACVHSLVGYPGFFAEYLLCGETAPKPDHQVKYKTLGVTERTVELGVGHSGTRNSSRTEIPSSGKLALTNKERMVGLVGQFRSKF